METPEVKDENEIFLRENEAGSSKDPDIKHTKVKLKEKKRTKLLLYGSIILNLLLIALIVITIVYMVSEVPEIRRESNLCLNCSYLRLHPNDDLSMFSKSKGDICCVKDGGNYSSMTNKVKNEWVNKWITRCAFSSRVFQSYKDDFSLIMKDCVQWNPVYD